MLVYSNLKSSFNICSQVDRRIIYFAYHSLKSFSMARSSFLTLSAIFSVLIGFTMLVAPEWTLLHIAKSADVSAFHVLQWAGDALLAIGVINFLARYDEGSEALSALMIGNVIFHALETGVDIYHFCIGFLNVFGLVSLLTLHLILLAGFIHYLRQMNK